MEDLGEVQWGGHDVQPGDFYFSPRVPAAPVIESSEKDKVSMGPMLLFARQLMDDKAQKRKHEADHCTSKACKHVSDHMPGRATATSSSNGCGLNVQCRACLSDEGPGRMGPVHTHYAGLFYCKRCWDSVEAADPRHQHIPEGGSGLMPAGKYDHEVVIGELYERRGRKKVRLLERNEAGLWKVQYMDQHVEDDMPETALVAINKESKEQVESIEELKAMMNTLFAEIPEGASRHLSLKSLNPNIYKRFSRKIDPKLFGHNKLIMLMRDAQLSGEFEERDQWIYQVQSSLKPLHEEHLK